MCSLLTARLQVRVCDNGELSAVESVGMSYVYPASMPLGWSVARLTRESVITAGRDNECAVPGLTAEARRLTAIAIM